MIKAINNITSEGRACIPVEMIMDSAVACVMDRVDMVVCGAEAIVENGGIVNKENISPFSFY